MIGIANRAPAELIERARRLYTGVDPDTGVPLTKVDCARMAGAAIASLCDVHPHTVDGWIRRYGWSRPPWYRRRQARKPVQPGAVAKKLVERVEAAASAGSAMPDNFRLAREIGCSIQGLCAALRGLRAKGIVRSERDGPCRRLVLGDGRATAWSRLQRGPQDLVEGPVERRTMPERVLDAVKRWVEADVPLPSNAAGARDVGCEESTFRRALAVLRDTGQLSVEQKSNRRCVVLPDGRATRWSVPYVQVKPGKGASSAKAGRRVRYGAAPLDLVAEEAVRALRRQGPVVFDLAVVTACAPGVAWSVDGRTMTRDQLVAEAARRNARATQQLGAAP